MQRRLAALMAGIGLGATICALAPANWFWIAVIGGMSAALLTPERGENPPK